jgi:phenylacetate-CoA ligase
MIFTPMPDRLPAGDDLQKLQQRKLAELVALVQTSNPFYRRKLAGIAPWPADDLLSRLPFTTREELETDQANSPPFGTDLTFPLERYCRFHQTSGTHGRAMRWLDTTESWAWFGKCWTTILDAAGVNASDRLFFPFSFGPFVGFWAAFESAAALGRLCIPGGGMSTERRLRMILDNEVTVVFCTPTYALRMAEVARGMKIDLAASSVRTLLVAGEAGGSIPATRQLIESAWGARVFDHSGMTEIGAVTFECRENPGTGLHIIESEFIAEVIDPVSTTPVEEGQPGELVLSNLGRLGSPLIRYRTGDRVRLSRRPCPCGRPFARLEGGILDRIDDMFVVRGNNVFPAAVESILRGFPEVAEFRMSVHDDGPLAQVKLELEPTAGSLDNGLGGRVERALQSALSFRAEVLLVQPGTLPRFEMKSQRFIRSAGSRIAGDC